MVDWLTTVTVVSAFPLAVKTDFGDFPVEYPVMEESLPLAERINKAMNESNGEFICILYGDALPEGNFIEPALKLIDEYAGVLEAGIVQNLCSILFHRNVFDEIGHFRRDTDETVMGDDSIVGLLIDYELRSSIAGFDTAQIKDGKGDWKGRLGYLETPSHELVQEYSKISTVLVGGKPRTVKGYRIFYPH